MLILDFNFFLPFCIQGICVLVQKPGENGTVKMKVKLVRRWHPRKR